MKYLLPNQANQTLHLTLNEGRYYFDEAFTHYLMVISFEDTGEETENSLAQVLNVVNETTRDTEVTLTTVGLYYTGDSAQRYRYVVYGQNSSTNTDPTDDTVLGVVERGQIIISANGQFYQPDTSDAPIDNTVKYG